MKTTDGLLKFSWTVCLAFGAALASPAQQLPPLPPLPSNAPPTLQRSGPVFRPVPLRASLDTNRLPASAVPSMPIPLIYPPHTTLPTTVASPPVASPPMVAPAAVAPAAPHVTNPGALVFDAEQKEYSAKLGEIQASLTFNLTNVSSSEVVINRVSTSCGCTVAHLPQQPWHLAAGTNGSFGVTVDLRGKSGTIMKSVTVDSTAGMKSLLVKVSIPPPQLIAAANTNNMDRIRNQERAKADRQAVFKADCAECHVKPAIGRLGKELFAGSCGVCHEAEHRATMVPDLHALKHPDTREYWTQTISEGKLNSLMPAFALKNGGILNDQQIVSLVDYLMTGFPKEAKPAPRVTALPFSPVVAPQVKPGPQTNASIGNPLTAPAPGPVQFPNE